MRDWLAQWFWKSRFLKFCPLFSQFRNSLPLEQGGALHLNYKFNPLHPRMLAPSLPENDPVFDLEEKIFKILSIIFAIISPWNKEGPFIWINLYPSGSGKDDFSKLSVYFHTFVIISPLEKRRALHLALCQVWLKLAQWSWRRRRKCEKLRQQTNFDQKSSLEHSAQVS